MWKSSKKESEETGGIRTWTEICLLPEQHSNYWAIGNLDMRYKTLRTMNATSGSTPTEP